MNKERRHGLELAALLLALVLMIGCAIGGTLAWLIADTGPVTNTFTYGNIDLTLDETKVNLNGDPVDGDGNPVEGGEDPARTNTGNKYKLLPGREYLKDPVVTVAAGSEACWLFVKVEEIGGKLTLTAEDGTTQVDCSFGDFLTYAIADGWTELNDGDSTDGVHVYCWHEAVEAIPANGEPAAFHVLKDDKVTVNSGISKAMMDALKDGDPNNAPTLKITAYAVQREGIETAAAAWALVPKPAETQQPPETQEPAGDPAPAPAP